MLWITFKSCIFAFWNNIYFNNGTRTIVVNYIQILYLCILKQPCRCPLLMGAVVNYIQILYLCILKQLGGERLGSGSSCELHSNLVSLHSETTKVGNRTLSILLWITFKSCIFAFWNNIDSLLPVCPRVVNYIQILYLCILKQLTRLFQFVASGCELHSNLVSLHSETTSFLAVAVGCKLWITFKSCIFAFWNN